MIVTNSSPLIHLVSVFGELEILGEIFGRVIVPLEVLDELEAGRHRDQTIEVVRQASCVELLTGPCVLPPSLSAELDIGEASVIQIALTSNVAQVLLDDRLGRKVARREGLTVFGTVAVLIRAKHLRKLSSLRQTLDQLRKEGMWIDERLFLDALKLAGET